LDRLKKGISLAPKWEKEERSEGGKKREGGYRLTKKGIKSQMRLDAARRISETFQNGSTT